MIKVPRVILGALNTCPRTTKPPPEVVHDLYYPDMLIWLRKITKKNLSLYNPTRNKYNESLEIMVENSCQPTPAWANVVSTGNLVRKYSSAKSSSHVTLLYWKTNEHTTDQLMSIHLLPSKTEPSVTPFYTHSQAALMMPKMQIYRKVTN